MNNTRKKIVEECIKCTPKKLKENGIGYNIGYNMCRKEMLKKLKELI